LEGLVFASESGLLAETGERSQADHWAHVMQQLGWKLEDLPEFERGFWGGDRVDVALVDYIRSLRKRYTTALLSNAWDGTRKNALSVYDFSDAFDLLIFSAEVGLRKPGREIFDLILHRLGVQPEEAVFVDDFPHNIAGAQAVGLHTVPFKSHAQAIQDLERVLAANPPAEP
jgi:HAD superfamily hydrolase (TIGR01509 family)